MGHRLTPDLDGDMCPVLTEYHLAVVNRIRSPLRVEYLLGPVIINPEISIQFKYCPVHMKSIIYM